MSAAINVLATNGESLTVALHPRPGATLHLTGCGDGLPHAEPG